MWPREGVPAGPSQRARVQAAKTEKQRSAATRKRCGAFEIPKPGIVRSSRYGNALVRLALDEQVGPQGKHGEDEPQSEPAASHAPYPVREDTHHDQGDQRVA